MKNILVFVLIFAITITNSANIVLAVEESSSSAFGFATIVSRDNTDSLTLPSGAESVPFRIIFQTLEELEVIILRLETDIEIESSELDSISQMFTRIDITDEVSHNITSSEDGIEIRLEGTLAADVYSIDMYIGIQHKSDTNFNLSLVSISTIRETEAPTEPPTEPPSNLPEGIRVAARTTTFQDGSGSRQSIAIIWGDPSQAFIRWDPRPEVWHTGYPWVNPTDLFTNPTYPGMSLANMELKYHFYIDELAFIEHHRIPVDLPDNAVRLETEDETLIEFLRAEFTASVSLNYDQQRIDWSNHAGIPVNTEVRFEKASAQKILASEPHQRANYVMVVTFTDDKRYFLREHSFLMLNEIRFFASGTPHGSQDLFGRMPFYSAAVGDNVDDHDTIDLRGNEWFDNFDRIQLNSRPQEGGSEDNDGEEDENSTGSSESEEKEVDSELNITIEGDSTIGEEDDTIGGDGTTSANAREIFSNTTIIENMPIDDVGIMIFEGLFDDIDIIRIDLDIELISLDDDDDDDNGFIFFTDAVKLWPFQDVQVDLESVNNNSFSIIPTGDNESIQLRNDIDINNLEEDLLLVAIMYLGDLESEEYKLEVTLRYVIGDPTNAEEERYITASTSINLFVEEFNTVT